MRKIVLAALLAVAAPSAAFAQDSDPGMELAMTALDGMAAKLRTLDSFELNADVTTEEVFTNGEKLQFLNHVRYVVDRPDKLYVSVRSDRKYRRYYYDGSHLTVTAPTMAYYATVPMTGTIKQLLDLAYDEYGIDVPLEDLFLWGTPDAPKVAPTEALYVGFAQVGDHATDQYFYRAEGVDWQIWIGRDDQMPYRIVITNTEDPAQPDYVANLTWNLSPDLGAGRFTYTPTSDDKPIELEKVANAASR